MDLPTFKLRVGQRLGVVPVAGSLDASDGELVTSAYELLVHELTEHSLAWWDATGNVPDEYADIMVGMTAARLIDDFTIAEPRRSQLLMQSAFGLPVASVDERRLRRLLSNKADPDAAETDRYF